MRFDGVPKLSSCEMSMLFCQEFVVVLAVVVVVVYTLGAVAGKHVQNAVINQQQTKLINIRKLLINRLTKRQLVSFS